MAIKFTGSISTLGNSLEDLFGIEACKGWMDKVDQASLSGKPLQAIDLVAEALERHERGEKSDYD
ncbi:hypothetical protein [Pseudomonas alabamensis]|uniref:hypothetical protein n=1 Tax=Pseudomonas alabamensis TaxID=3064349 RepID=UPI003F64DA6B